MELAAEYISMPDHRCQITVVRRRGENMLGLLGYQRITVHEVEIGCVRDLIEELVGRAVYNVTPEQTGAYFHKIQCFCFSNQRLEAGQEVRMPVIYYVDPAMLKDEDASDVQEITLSYTFMPAAGG